MDNEYIHCFYYGKYLKTIPKKDIIYESKIGVNTYIQHKNKDNNIEEIECTNYIISNSSNITIDSTKFKLKHD